LTERQGCLHREQLILKGTILSKASPPEQRGRYQSVLRDRQKQATREALLSAAGRILEEEGFSGLSYAAIARVAEVQERTAYRHFPNKNILLTALWEWINRKADIPGFPATYKEINDLMGAAYVGFDRQERLIRALLMSSQGRELRLRMNAERQAAYLTVAADAASLPADQLRGFASLLQLLCSASAWANMKDYWDMDGATSGRICLWAIRVLTEVVRTGGGGHDLAIGTEAKTGPA
jgi:AcrR family transcriptional regulator